MEYLNLILEQLRKDLLSFESESYSASKRNLKDNPELVNIMVGKMILIGVNQAVNTIEGVSLQDIEYESQIMIDLNYGSDEF